MTLHTCCNCLAQIPAGKEVPLQAIFAAFGFNYICESCDTEGKQLERALRAGIELETEDPITGRITREVLKL